MSVFIHDIAAKVLHQVEAGDRQATKYLVLGRLTREITELRSRGIEPQEKHLPLVAVANILASEDSAWKIFPRFVAEVPNWRNFYPIAKLSDGELRWKKLFDVPEELRTLG